MNQRSRFPRQAGDPPPLRAACERIIRFEEVDPLGIVWHGRYPSFLEDGRVALGRRYGVGYTDFFAAGLLTPIREIHIDYLRPLRFEDRIGIEALLHWSEAAKLAFEFVVRDPRGEVAASGATVQLITDREGALQITPPPFLKEFLSRWKSGEIG